jgi:ATP-dependent exoDNAse (exonuclease V) beta subunit
MTLLAKVAQLPKRNTIFVVGGTSRLEKLVADAKALMEGKRVASGQLSGFANWTDVQDRAYGRYGHPYGEFVKVIDDIGCYGVSKVLSRLAHSANAADVVLTTVHGSKGCQFDAVSVYDDFRGAKEKDLFFERMPTEVTRLLYVAVTRAKRALFMDRSLADRFNLTRILQAPVQDLHTQVEQDRPASLPIETNLPAVYPEPRFLQPPADLEGWSSREARSKFNRSTYEKYGDVLTGIAIGLFLWILLQ